MRLNFLIAFFLSVLLYSCEVSDTLSVQNKPDTYVSSSVDTLGLLIDLSSYKPKSASWTVKKMGIANDRTPGPTDYNIQVRMTFDDTTIARLTDTYRLLSTSYTPRDIQPFKFDWLPQEYVFDQDTTLGVTYQPTFFQASPYLNGGFIVNRNDILLSFYTQ